MMKSVVFCTLFAAAFAAPQYYKSASTTSRPYAILRLENEVYPDGSYNYAYDTENGISAQQAGQLKAIGDYYGNAAQGSYQYTSPEGVPVQIQYIADENGYQPVGAVLPTPPPIPEAIRRSVEFNIAAQQQRQSQPTNGFKRF